MGAYVYRVTSTRVRCSDGKEANVAIYAYKPSWNFFDGEKLNKKWHFQSGATASDRMAAAGRITDRVVLGQKDETTGKVTPYDGARVFQNAGNFGHFHDDYALGRDMPVIEGITIPGFEAKQQPQPVPF